MLLDFKVIEDGGLILLVQLCCKPYLLAPQPLVIDGRLLPQRHLNGLRVAQKLIYYISRLFVPLHDVSIVHYLLQVLLILLPALFYRLLVFYYIRALR